MKDFLNALTGFSSQIYSVHLALLALRQDLSKARKMPNLVLEATRPLTVEETSIGSRGVQLKRYAV